MMCLVIQHMFRMEDRRLSKDIIMVSLSQANCQWGSLTYAYRMYANMTSQHLTVI